uniref:ATP synthase F0 subunit 8 n=1 Tax=Cryptonome barbada TaxID=2204078 RepID=A0A343YV47_9ANNE|nr:ATP synthase F0 subunit 8 [Cryptonome barbada]AWN55968.1 ATP synthase F0 subunit 8 [Cryptonome barbada]
MPHLAPLSWLLASLLFWITLLTFSSSSWWSQTPSFATSKTMLPTPKFASWKW